MRDRTGVSLAGSAFFSVLFRGVFCKAASAGSSIIWSSRGKVPPQNILSIWLHETNYLFYVLRIRLVVLCHFEKCHWVVRPQVSCRSSVLKHLPRCQRPLKWFELRCFIYFAFFSQKCRQIKLCFFIYFIFLIKPATETYRVMNDLWPLCSTAGTGSLAASCGSNLLFCHVLFAPRTGGKKPVNRF